MIVIGLTGGIASGKSTVADMIRQRGIPVLDADVYARDVLNPGEPAYDQVIRQFGQDIVQENGWIDRKQLGAIVFHDAKQRQRLNDIVHPAVRQKMNDDRAYYTQQHYPAIVLDIPLLFENQLQTTVDYTLLVDVDEPLQRQRLMVRDGSTEEAAIGRIKAQMPLSEKRQLADCRIDNQGTKQETEAQLADILQSWSIN